MGDSNLRKELDTILGEASDCDFNPFAPGGPAREGPPEPAVHRWGINMKGSHYEAYGCPPGYKVIHGGWLQFELVDGSTMLLSSQVSTVLITDLGPRAAADEQARVMAEAHQRVMKELVR